MTLMTPFYRFLNSQQHCPWVGRFGGTVSPKHPMNTLKEDFKSLQAVAFVRKVFLLLHVIYF